MTTSIFFFLPPPNASGFYREAHPYGPNPSGFNTDLAIEIRADLRESYPAISVVSGLVQLIPDPPPTSTGTLILKPTLAAMRDLSSVVGKSTIIVFIYRNIDIESSRSHFEPIIAALGDRPFLESESVSSRVEKFLRGDYGVFVKGGTELALPSTNNSVEGWARIGFEISFLPGGLTPQSQGSTGLDSGWNRLKQIVKPDNTSTRHLDPMCFYSAVSSSSSENIRLDPSQGGHLLLTLCTRRILLELRDERDIPLMGDGILTRESANVFRNSTGATTEYEFTVDNLGTVELAVATGDNPTLADTFTVTRINNVFSELPSGSAASPNPSKTLNAPAHWAMQTIFISNTGDEPYNWFVRNTPSLPRYTENNKVTYLIDGLHTFREMVNSMLTVTSSGHYLRLAGWWLSDDFNMIPEEQISPNTFAELTQVMAQAGAQVRALLWDQVGWQNSAEKDHINSLPNGNGKAILDNDTPNPISKFGSHHQKLLVINGTSGAVAFCGGVDINPDRLDDPRHCAASPFHDVHAKIEGPAVADINTSFIERWNNHPTNPPTIPTTIPPFDNNPGSQFVQVTRTYAPVKRYPFAPYGDLGTLRQLINAIYHARKFIYLEDQYATPFAEDYDNPPRPDNVGIMNALMLALEKPSFEYLLILIPNHTDQPQNRKRRYNFIRSLRDAFPNKIHVFYLSRSCRSPGTAVGSTTAAADLAIGVPPGTNSRSSGSSAHSGEIYVHSKTWIVDDVYVKIGSANCNRRSLTHDTEIDIHIIDGALYNGARAFARRYRMDLWAEHLNMRGRAKRSLLEDPTFALKFWLNPPEGSHIRFYNEEAERVGWRDFVPWDVADPDGRS